MMIFIEGGTFEMGNAEGLADERPVHSVTIDSFYMESIPVTQEMWVALMGKNCSSFSSSPVDNEIQEKRPVDTVSFYDAILYCNKRSFSEGLSPCYLLDGSSDISCLEEPSEQETFTRTITCDWNADGYRLPTEAEWEYAAIGGNKNACNETAHSKKNNSLHDDIKPSNENCWHQGNSNRKTHQVGLKEPNSLGLYDMCGNVWEWCWDWYSCYPVAPATNPKGIEPALIKGSDKIGRGGAWNAAVEECSPWFRNCGSPDMKFNFLGLRVVRKG